MQDQDVMAGVVAAPVTITAAAAVAFPIIVAARRCDLLLFTEGLSIGALADNLPAGQYYDFAS